MVDLAFERAFLGNQTIHMFDQFRLGDANKLDQTDMAQLGKLTWADFEVPAMTVVQSKACN